MHNHVWLDLVSFYPIQDRMKSNKIIMTYDDHKKGLNKAKIPKNLVFL